MVVRVLGIVCHFWLVLKLFEEGQGVGDIPFRELWDWSCGAED